MELYSFIFSMVMSKLLNPRQVHVNSEPATGNPLQAQQKIALAFGEYSRQGLPVYHVFLNDFV